MTAPARKYCGNGACVHCAAAFDFAVGCPPVLLDAGMTVDDWESVYEEAMTAAYEGSFNSQGQC